MSLQAVYDRCEKQWLNRERCDYQRGLACGKRFSEFHVYEKRAIVNGRTTSIIDATPAFIRGIRDSGCKLR